MNNFEQVSRPLIFELDDEEISYWGKGSSFLIANHNNYYWVTASHALENMGGAAESLRIFPSDNSTNSLPFNEQYTINKGVCDDEEYKDIFMLRINLNEFIEFGDAPLIAQDIEFGFLPANQLKDNDVLWVIGYPSENNFIDYSKSKINNTRTVLKGNYLNSGICDHSHEMKINSSIELTNFDGLSGSPVFHPKAFTKNDQEIIIPLVVGMVLRGTSSSKIAHFVSSEIISNLVRLAENND